MTVALPVAVLATYVLALAVELAGLTPAIYASGQRPVTEFISRPDTFSIIVAVLAGIAGTIALTEAKASTLVGVLVSITTVPAAANIGVALAHHRGDEVVGAAGQLMLNIATIVLVGALTLRAQWALTQRTPRS